MEFGGLLILLAAYIIHMDQCTCERMEYERDLCSSATVVVGTKYYTVVDNAMVTFDQAVSTCASLGGRLPSTRYRAYFEAYSRLMRDVTIRGFPGARLYNFWLDIQPESGSSSIWRHPDGTEIDYADGFNHLSDVFDDPAVRCAVGYSSKDTVSCQELFYFACEFELDLDGPDSPCFPTVVLDTGSRPVDSPFQLLGAGDFSTFGSITDLDCPGDYSVAYTWKVREETVRSGEQPDIPAEISIREESLLSYHDNMITIPGNTLAPGKYSLLLCVSVSQGGAVTTAAVSTWVQIMLSPINILITGGSRRCSLGDNCNYLDTRAHDRLRLTAHCDIQQSRNINDWRRSYELGPEHSFYWSLKQAPDEFPGVDWENDTRTGQYQEELIVKDHVFTVPGEYIIRLDILTNGVLCVTGNCSYAEWKFTIPAPPANARQPVFECNRTLPYSELDPSWAGEGCECREVSNLCTVGPTEGIALTTRFDLSCLDFEGTGAIRYEYYYRTRATATVSTLVTSEESGHYNLLYHGMSPSPRPFKLPSGLAADDYRVFLLVKMSDQRGTTKTSELELTVRLPPFQDLLTAIDTTDAEVQRAIRWGDKMEAVHLSTITATTLNNIRAEGSYQVEDWRAARQAIISNVGRLPIESVESVIQSSESLIQATHYDDEVTADAQVNAAEQLLHMAKFMTRKIVEKNMTQEKVERVAGIVMTGAFNVFKCSEVVARWKHDGIGPPDDTDSTRSTLLKNRNATTTAFRAINELTDGVLRGKSKVEVVTMISSQDFQVVVNRTDCRSWFNYENHTVHFTSFEDGTWFRLPPLPVIVKAYARSVMRITGDISKPRLESIARNDFCAFNGTQVFHSRWRNPFEYATNFSRRDLKIGIGGLHFTDALERKGISGLEEPVEFSILRHNQSVAAVEFDDVTVDGEIVYVPFKYNTSTDPADMYIFLAPRDPPVPPTFTLYLAYGIKPNASQFDLTTTLPVPANMSYSLDLDENVTVTSDPYSWRVRLGDVEPVTWDGNNTNWYLGGRIILFIPFSYIPFHLKLKLLVGLLTSRTHLHCRCDHLTKFSGLVAPNEINFERALKGFLLLKNLIQNPVGIMTCCVLFSFYIALCVPWTRKNDAKDLGKVTTAAIFDDTEDPKARYYMRVFTGPRVHAGTTAKVSVMLHGATRECGPFLLHQPYSAMFERGNVAGFVLCTQTDPGWLTHVHVWHDNSGKEPSWFLDRIIVDDLLLEEQHYFLCNRWLAFDEDDEQIERVLPAAKDEQLVAFSTLFADRTTK
ncbi:polycystin-1-like protein 2 [Branchiostoma floridae x Branchiostoma belcheri]